MAQNWLDQLTPNFTGMPVDQGQLNMALMAQNQQAEMPMPSAPPAQTAVAPPEKRPMTALSKYIPAPQPGMSPQSAGYADLSKRALQDQSNELEGLNKYITDLANKPQAINFQPLAAFVDNLTGSKLAGAAKDIAPMSEDDRDKMLFGLKQQLAGDQARYSGAQLQAAKEQQTIEQFNRTQAEKERHDAILEQKMLQANPQADRVKTMMGTQALQQVSKIHDDKIIQQMRQQAVNIDKGMDLLGTPNVSNKALSEVAQDIAGALNPKGGATDLKLRELMTPSLQTKLSDFVAYATANPDQPAPPDVVKFWRNMGGRIQNSLDEQMQARAQGKLAGLQTAAKLNPMAYEAAKEAADLYKTGGWRMLEGRPVPGAIRNNDHPEDNEAVRWAKSNLNDPRSAQILKANGL